MQALLSLLKEKQVALWCKGAAWVIALIGVINVILECYGYLHNNYAGMSFFDVLASLARVILTSLSGTLFSFSILYAVATLIAILSANAQEEEEEEEEEEQVDEMLLPGQRLH